MRPVPRLTLLALASVIAACNSSDGPTSPAPGQALVQVQLSGVLPPGFAYRVSLDGAEATVSAADSVALGSLSPGTHAILVTPLSLTCIPDWYVPQTVAIESGKTATVSFTIRCLTPAPAGIVFASSRDNIRRNIYRMDPDGGNVQRLTNWDMGDDFPAVAPGGTRMAVQRQASSGLPQVWVMDIDGSHATRVSTADNLEHTPVWSPDGRRLAYIRWLGQDSINLIVATPDGRSEVVLLTGRRSFGSFLSSPLWSPNGRQITVNVWDGATYNNIRVIDVETGIARDVALPRDSLQATALAWTPDGKLLFNRLHQRPGESNDLRIGAIDGSSDQVLMTTPSGLVSAAYSPDGLSIALAAYDSTSTFDIYRIPAAGGTPVNITNTPQVSDLTPSWIP